MNDPPWHLYHDNQHDGDADADADDAEDDNNNSWSRHTLLEIFIFMFGCFLLFD